MADAEKVIATLPKGIAERICMYEPDPPEGLMIAARSLERDMVFRRSVQLTFQADDHETLVVDITFRACCWRHTYRDIEAQNDALVDLLYERGYLTRRTP